MASSSTIVAILVTDTPFHQARFHDENRLFRTLMLIDQYGSPGKIRVKGTPPNCVRQAQARPVQLSLMCHRDLALERWPAGGPRSQWIDLNQSTYG